MNKENKYIVLRPRENVDGEQRYAIETFSTLREAYDYQQKTVGNIARLIFNIKMEEFIN